MGGFVMSFSHCSLVVLLTTLVLFSSVHCQEVLTQPEQVHLSYGADATQMIVTWVTLNSTQASSIVEYGQKSFNMKAVGEQSKFIDGGPLKRAISIHTAVMTGLHPGQQYGYHCGSSEGWSELFYFTAKKDGEDWSPRFAVYGDMGNKNAQSLARLQEETQKGHFDAILHVGDYAYDMHTDDGLIGDEFMRQIQPIAAYLPYMTCPGNHEGAYNFSNYKYRFTMPGDNKKMYFSFDVGPAHIVSFDSEAYYQTYDTYGKDVLANQYAWLDNELREANKPENRAKHPWLITMCHRPLYCSNSDDNEHCPNSTNAIRVGLNKYTRQYSIEDLLYKYTVDLHLQAHEHSYERMWPVYKEKVCNGSISEPYTNPNAPVHIVTGSAGCQEDHDPFIKLPYDYSAYHSVDYGYSRMTIHNNTHIYMEQVSDDKGGMVIDKMWLVKTKREPYTCHMN